MRDVCKQKGKEYWRSLDQLADKPEFREMLEREFPEGASEMKNPLTRRNFLTLMGASIALAGLSACRRPVEKIVPYVKAPEQIIPGIPNYYATTMPLGTSAYGVVVESHEGRPTKIEGNTQHPASLGKSSSWMQASVLSLYDPDRSQQPVNKGVDKDWSDFVAFLKSIYQEYKSSGGEGLAVLTESYSSPSLARLKNKFKKTYSNSSWVSYSPLSVENVYQGLEFATGTSYHPNYQYGKAAVILSVDSDFLLTEPDAIINTKGFAAGRRVESTKDTINRLYVVETSYSTTGAMADHRLKLSGGQMSGFLLLLARELANQGLDLPIVNDLKFEGQAEIDSHWISAVAKDLIGNGGNCLVVAGNRQPAITHAVVFAINQALGNIDKSVFYRELKDIDESNLEAFAGLTRDMKAGKVKTLIMLGGNPVYNAPADLDFAKALEKVENSIHLSPAMDETSQKSSWHIPQSHFLESWGDATASDGTLSVIQPLIAPLYNSHSALEIVNLICTGSEKKSYDIVKETWKDILNPKDQNKMWRRVLHDGVLADSQLPRKHPLLNDRLMKEALGKNPIIVNLPKEEDLEINFHVSPAVHDGRFANNGWLQELPDTITKLTWDNAALVSHKTAQKLGVKNEDIIVLNMQGRELTIPVWILPGQADFCISISLGYGRSAAGRIGNQVGFNAYKLRTLTAYYFDVGLTVRKTSDQYTLASTQDHSSMEGRPLVREATIGDYRQHPEFAGEMVKHPPLVSLWEECPYDKGYQWGMSIDLNACTGCNACTIACQSENNVPIIGKEQVKNGREMHWIRIDRYFSGDLDNPEMVHQPVGCHHCEMAPCEQVCPVAATVHDEEGLNVMTYNRCVGTRYCSNNCPYKVRRFNFFNYSNEFPEVVKMVQNPDVTVRSRGVMEKCTYCVQRINAAKINARNENTTLADGDVRTACQQACPADAIVFGNIRDQKSAVSEAKQNNRRYEMLAELNLKPRTSYLARLRNPNPDLVES